MNSETNSTSNQINYQFNIQELLKIKETTDLQTLLKEIFILFPKFELFFKHAENNKFELNTYENVFKFINIMIFKFFIEEKVNYEDKFILMKDVFVQFYHFFTNTKEFTDIQKHILSFFSMYISIDELKELKKLKCPSNEFDQFVRKFYSFYVGTMMNIHKNNDKSIDDLLGMTDCNGKKEKEYWIQYIISGLKKVDEKTLLDIIDYLHMEKKKKTFDVEIDLSLLTLDQLRYISNVIRNYIYHQPNE